MFSGVCTGCVLPSVKSPPNIEPAGKHTCTTWPAVGRALWSRSRQDWRRLWSSGASGTLGTVGGSRSTMSCKCIVEACWFLCMLQAAELFNGPGFPCAFSYHQMMSPPCNWRTKSLSMLSHSKHWCIARSKNEWQAYTSTYRESFYREDKGMDLDQAIQRRTWALL